MRILAKPAFLVLLTLLTVAASGPAQSVVYFLVGEFPGQEIYYDSYVLPLHEPDEIQHARNLIEYGPGFGDPLVVAKIAAESNGINRDYLAPGFPEWSWHIEEFSTFAFATIEILDGWPGFVEDDVDGWIQNTNGYIGFWNYTVIDEITLVPEPGTVVLLLSVIALPLVLRRR
jgi:hypothetical protein